MISVTLTFDTYEAAITSLASMRNPATAPKPEAEKVVKPPKSATTEPNAAGKPGAKVTPESVHEKKVNGSLASATQSESVDDYAPVGALIKKLVATNRAQVLAVLTEFGVTNGKELAPAQYASFTEKLEASVSSLD